MKFFHGLVCAGLLWAGIAGAQSPVTLTVDPRALGASIPDDFLGLSFGMKTLPANGAGQHLFSDTNTPLIALFRNLGLTHLRVGGTTVESPPSTPIPDEGDIDNLFAFARAAGVKKIIYSLRLLETNASCHYATTNVAIAKYIWAHYRPLLDCFAIGNEPDLGRVFKQDFEVRNFSTYLKKWERFASAITNALPEAKFTGPDGGSGNIKWTTAFAAAENKAGVLCVASEHYYPGEAGKGRTVSQGVEDMLGPDSFKRSANLYKKMARPVLSMGLPYRFTEANDHYSGGIPGASDTFAGALWALDFLHWWAARGASGVDFHNTTWVSSDVIAPDSTGQMQIKPKGYGIKAFNLGGHGKIVPLSISNLDGVNLSAYAALDGSNLFVTVINKEYGAGARDVEATILSGTNSNRAETIALTCPNGDVTAKESITLGGAHIGPAGPWLGKWTPLKTGREGNYRVKVPAVSAMIVKIAVK